MCQPASWPCVNKCPSFLCYQENECHQGKAPWTVQGYMHSLTFSMSEINGVSIPNSCILALAALREVNPVTSNPYAMWLLEIWGKAHQSRSHRLPSLSRLTLFVISFMLTSTEPQHPFCNNLTLFSPDIHRTQASSCLKRCSFQLLFFLSSSVAPAASYFFIIFSIVSLWDASSCHNSSGAVHWNATNDLLINKWNSLFLSSHSVCSLEMSGSGD